MEGKVTRIIKRLKDPIKIKEALKKAKINMTLEVIKNRIKNLNKTNK